MKIIILTSSLYGTAGHHLPYLIEGKCCEISMVVFNKGLKANKNKYYFQKIKKVFKIGFLGALNGIRMRKWFTSDITNYKKIRNVKEICYENNIPFREVNNINSEKTVDLFLETKADLGISLGNGYITSKIFNLPKYGMINIHHEILPAFQNAQSIIWQLFKYSKNTGYTIHKINKSIDSGDILYQELIPIEFKNTLAKTIAFTSIKLLEASAKGLIYTIKNLESIFYSSRKQESGSKYTTPTIWQYYKIYKNYRKLRNTN